MIKACGFALGKYGDLIIQTVPARAFKETYPDSKLTLSIGQPYKDILPLFFKHPRFDDHHIFEGYDNWPTQSDKDYINYRNYDFVFRGMPIHTTKDWYNYYTYGEEACKVQGLPIPQDISYFLNPWFDLYDDCKKNVTLSLCPNFSQNLEKTLSHEKCEDLCIQIKKLGYNPIQVGGRFDLKLKNAICPYLSIFEATKLILSSKMHITADTFYSSVCGAYNHQCVGFYGLNYPDMTDCFSHLPPNRNAFYFRCNNVNDLKVEQIINKLKDIL